MAINTGGGFAGGLASGIESGFGIAGQLANQQLQQQEFGLRKQQFDLMSQEERMKLHEGAIKGIEDQIGQVDDSLAGFSRQYDDMKARGATPDELSAVNNDPRLQQLMQRRQALQGARQNHFALAYGQQVIGGLDQAKQDAHDLSVPEGSPNYKTPQDLGPDRFYNVVGLTGHPAINYVTAHDHNGDGQADGQSPIGQQLDTAHRAAAQGDWSTAHDAVVPLMAPFVSHLPSDDPNHTAGLNVPYPADPNDPHGHIGQTFQTVGNLGLLHAGLNSDPDAQNLIMDAHKNGATDRFNAAKYLLLTNGGAKGLAQKVAEGDPLEREYLFVKGQLRDANPNMSEADLSDAAMARVKPDPLAPEKLRQKFEAPKQAADITRSDAETHRANVESTILIPAQVKAEGARADQESANAEYTRNLKGRTHEQIYQGTDGEVYYFDPATRSTTDGSGNPPPQGVTLTKIGTPRAGAGGAGKVQTLTNTDLSQTPITPVTDSAGRIIGYQKLPELDPSAPGAPPYAPPGGMGGSAPAAAPAAPAGIPSLPSPKSQQEYDTLPGGSQYLDPHGAVRVKAGKPASRGRRPPPMSAGDLDDNTGIQVPPLPSSAIAPH